jgi:hypothetical protein
MVGARAAVIARAHRVAAQLIGGDREIHVVGDEEIELAIAVVVDERGARAPVLVADLRLPGDIGEGAVAAVVVERVGTERGDEEVEVAVVVIVADGHAHAVATQADAGALGHVGEAKHAAAARADREVVAKETTRGDRGQTRCGAPGVWPRSSAPPCTRKTSRSPSLS